MPNSNTYYNHFFGKDLFSPVKENNHETSGKIYNRHWYTLVESAFKMLQIKQKVETARQVIFTAFFSARTFYSIKCFFESMHCNNIEIYSFK